MQCHQRKRNGRAGKGFGRYYRDLRPRMNIDAPLALTRDGTTNDIDHPEDTPTLALDLLHRRQGIEGFAGLTHRDVERVLFNHRIAIAKLRSRLGTCGQARELLDHARTQAAGDICRAAAEYFNPPHLEQFSRRELETAEMTGVKAGLEPPAQSPPNSLGLLGYFLAH